MKNSARLALFGSLALLSAPASIAQSQLSDWFESPDRPRIFAARFDGPAQGWAAWQAYSAQIGGRLVSFTTPDEELFWRHTLGPGHAVVGLSRATAMDPFVWESGDALNWPPPWASNHPLSFGTSGYYESSASFASFLGYTAFFPVDQAIIEVDEIQDCDGNGIHDPVELLNGGTSVDSDNDGILDLCEIPGIAYCESTIPNSRGLIATVTAMGSNEVAANDLILRAADMPLTNFGFWMSSQTTASEVQFAGSNGTLCIGAPIVRLNQAPYVAFNTGLAGTAEIVIDLTNLTQMITVQPGETWNFQAWYRDFDSGMLTSNTTQAVSITFAP